MPAGSPTLRAGGDFAGHPFFLYPFKTVLKSAFGPID
jgi:hypothetical protein